MVALFIDADACPVKEEAMHVATRHGIKIFIVSDGGIRPSRNILVKLIIVEQGADAADDWIANHISSRDICITSDIPLAARCLIRGAMALKPNGDIFSENNIGNALANRKLSQSLRDAGQVTSGPKPFTDFNRSNFLNKLEVTIQKAKKLSQEQSLLK